MAQDQMSALLNFIYQQTERSPLEGLHVPIDHSCGDIIPGHSLLVRSLSVDEYAVRIKYRITPALPDWRDGLEPYLTWNWFAQDNLLNEYQEAGGAYGLAEDRESTEGVLSLTPLPPPGARSLKIFLNPLSESGTRNCECILEVELSV